MPDRFELRAMYARAWDTWDSDLLRASLADGFYFDDPAVAEPITASTIAAYMAGWQGRVASLGGSGEITSRDRVKADADGALVTWHWWSFAGTKFEGSAVTRTTDDGVRYERITYYPTTPAF